MRVIYEGKPFTGVTYNQGLFAGNRGHLFLKGQIQCSYPLNLQANNRIYQVIKTIAKLENVIQTGKVCKQCAKNVSVAINSKKNKK